MTLCNMSIEAGSRVGMIAPDDTTFAYLKGRPLAPNLSEWDTAVAYWKSLPTDDDAVFDREVAFDVSSLAPRVSWGTTPEENLPITATVPDPMAESDPARRQRMRRSLDYMGLTPGVGSRGHRNRPCLHRLVHQQPHRRSAYRSKDCARPDRRAGVAAIVVPGSASVRIQAEAEGLDRIFRGGGIRVARGRMLDVRRHER